MNIKLNIPTLVALSWCSAFLLFPTSGHAQSAPSLINYQGKLTDASGNPLPNGPYGVAIRIWSKKDNSQPGNSLVWGQEYNVAVVNGIFNAILGAPGGTPITNAAVNDLSFAFSDAERYVGLTVTRGTNGALLPAATEIVPRQRVLSAPYSLNSINANFASFSSNGVPPGTVIAFAGPQPPAGFLVCDGRPVSSQQYPDLYAAIGNTWGNGTGGTNNFNLPDLNGRCVVGCGAGAGLTPRNLAQKGGEETHALTVAELPSHNHDIFTYGDGDASQQQIKSTGTFSPVTKSTGYTGGNQAHNNMQPFVVLNYIIKY